MTAAAVPGPPQERSLPRGYRLALEPRVRVWGGGAVLVGGSPWRVSRMAPASQEFLGRLATAGSVGAAALTDLERRVARLLVDRGFAHPLPNVGSITDCAIVIPVLNRIPNLVRLLGTLPQSNVVVVDDGSDDPDALAAAAQSFGARVVRHPVNRGPAAARNTGLRATETELVAFIDSDCQATSDWPAGLLFHFDDPAVAAVAPRVIPEITHDSALEKYEAGRSALDMGTWPELVLSGARLGFVPSAALVVRRSALGDVGFDDALRVGEDVDLVWRLTEAGWQVRFDPSVAVTHETRARFRDWIVRRFEYGTSAPHLNDRHPGNLTPARISAWNLAVLGLVATRQHTLAAGTAALATSLLWRQLRTLPAAPALATRTVGQGLLADCAGIGHMLRREWWPMGAAALALTPRSRTARLAAACMLAPVLLDWAREDCDLDPIRYTALRLIDDAAYGSGVIVSSARSRTAKTLLPSIRVPGWATAKSRLSRSSGR